MRMLLTNQQGGILAQMSVSPHQLGHHRTLTGLVVHTVVVLLSRPNTELLLPFINMITNPASLEVRGGGKHVVILILIICSICTCQQCQKTSYKKSDSLEVLFIVSQYF